MQAISQQPEEDPLLVLKAEARNQDPLPLSLITIHQLDSTYYGEINKSYQKEGIGVLLTLTFQAYFGFWKNNRPEGKGLVLFPTGEVIYGEFCRNALAGVGVVDDGKFLRVGVFEGLDLQGVGFEYTYPTCKWRMLRYVRGTPTDELREEVKPLAEGLPNMLAAQHSLYQLLANYLDGHFFIQEQRPRKKNKANEPQEKYLKLNEVMVSRKEELIALGFRDQGGMHGLGAIINRKDQALMEAGYYVGGDLEGFCLESPDGSYREIGPFFAGVKHGAFIRQTSHGAEMVDFSEGKEVGESAIAEEQVVKRQRSYNFQQKDFLSARNSIDFDCIFQLFTPPQARHRASQHSHSKEAPYYQMPTPEPRAASRHPQKRQLLHKQRISHTFLGEGEKEGERTCVDIMRQKMRGYDMVRTEKTARLGSEQRRRNILDSNLRVFNNEEQESIAEEENPFDSALRGNNLLHESPKRRH